MSRSARRQSRALAPFGGVMRASTIICGGLDMGHEAGIERRANMHDQIRFPARQKRARASAERGRRSHWDDRGMTSDCSSRGEVAIHDDSKIGPLLREMLREKFARCTIHFRCGIQPDQRAIGPLGLVLGGGRHGRQHPLGACAPRCRPESENELTNHLWISRPVPRWETRQLPRRAGDADAR